MTTETISPKPADLPIFIRDAVAEQQNRVWRLRNLISCVREANRDLVDDYEAALSGLVDLADDIHLGLDTGVLAARAAALQMETQGSRKT
jgi:hypothetical protein